MGAHGDGGAWGRTAEEQEANMEEADADAAEKTETGRRKKLKTE